MFSVDPNFVSMIWVLDQPDPEIAATDLVADLIANQGWINSDGSNLMILMKDVGYGASTDDRTFIRPEDSLSGFPTTTGSGDAWKHPFLRNATTGGEMKDWMTTFRDTLKAELALSEFEDSLTNCHFTFDVEPLVVDEGGNCVVMLDFLANNSTIWTTWKVPGSEGWQPSASHATNTTGQTLTQMYAEMVVATDGGPDEWPSSLIGELIPERVPKKSPTANS